MVRVPKHFEPVSTFGILTQGDGDHHNTDATKDNTIFQNLFSQSTP